jgi:diacylglycerol kinase family enzyme
MEIIVNPSAHGGRGRERWEAIAGEVARRLAPVSVFVSNGAEATTARVARCLDAGERDFVAAGGDGTVRLVAQAILDRSDSRIVREVRLGAIGLGSSNDFHKPFDASRRIGGIPCRIDFGLVDARDVGVLECAEAEGPRYWFLNASCGLTAEANRIFNHPGPLLELMKGRSGGGAIVCAALQALAANRARALRLENGAGCFECPDAVNLGIVISPHFTGALRYDSPFEPASGSFYIHLCREWRIAGKIRTLADLARGRFMGRGRTMSWRSEHLAVRADAPMPVEFDGEVIETARVLFSIRPSLLRVCR